MDRAAGVREAVDHRAAIELDRPAESIAEDRPADRAFVTDEETRLDPRLTGIEGESGAGVEPPAAGADVAPELATGDQERRVRVVEHRGHAASPADVVDDRAADDLAGAPHPHAAGEEPRVVADRAVGEGAGALRGGAHAADEVGGDVVIDHTVDQRDGRAVIALHAATIGIAGDRASLQGDRRGVEMHPAVVVARDHAVDHLDLRVVGHDPPAEGDRVPRGRGVGGSAPPGEGEALDHGARQLAAGEADHARGVGAERLVAAVDGRDLGTVDADQCERLAAEVEVLDVEPGSYLDGVAVDRFVDGALDGVVVVGDEDRVGGDGGAREERGREHDPDQDREEGVSSAGPHLRLPSPARRRGVAS